MFEKIKKFLKPEPPVEKISKPSKAPSKVSKHNSKKTKNKTTKPKEVKSKKVIPPKKLIINEPEPDEINKKEEPAFIGERTCITCDEVLEECPYFYTCKTEDPPKNWHNDKIQGKPVPSEPTHKFKIVTLCGSTKFKDEYMLVQKEFTLMGTIVISVGCFGHSDKDDRIMQNKGMLDKMHLAKIDMADEIYVINVDGYIGSSTEKEIKYAMSKNKKVLYLNPPKEVSDSHKTCSCGNDAFRIVNDEILVCNVCGMEKSI